MSQDGAHRLFGGDGIAPFDRIYDVNDAIGHGQGTDVAYRHFSLRKKPEICSVVRQAKKSGHLEMKRR